jgi:hypothetical protein
MRFVLALQPENDEARVQLRRVRFDVRETSIERNENSILGIADFANSRIEGAAQFLLERSLHPNRRREEVQPTPPEDSRRS